MTSLPVKELLATPAAEAGERANAIELRGVSKSFGDAVALHPLDLDIRDGEFFCLLGPSGCGKTTTLNIIGGFTAPSSGVVRIAGDDMTKRPPNRRPVNTVFQSYALFPHLNVLENVSFGLRMARVGKSEQRMRAREALDLVGLGAFAERPVSQLSGGQARRVGVAGVSPVGCVSAASRCGRRLAGRVRDDESVRPASRPPGAKTQRVGSAGV